MDKRTLIFVLSLTLTLFLVNTYFQGQHEEELQKWHSQQKVKKEKKIVEIERELQQRQLRPSQLPIATLYREKTQEKLQGYGVIVDGAILTTRQDAAMPETVYSDTGAYTLSYQFDELSGPVLYNSNGKKLEIAPLPYFGKFDLQLVSTGGDKAHVVLGQYNDGHFSIPSVTLQELKSELGQETEGLSVINSDAVAMLKVENRYLPVAIYIHESRSLIHLNQVAELPTTIVKDSAPAIPGEKKDEEFFVLENEFQQLVFSSFGGALVEINLPFESETHPNSVVKEIEVDRQMVEDHPYNALFPARPFILPGGKSVQQGKLGGYYPLLRRDLIETGNRKSIRVLPKFYALNVVSEYPETAELPYTVKEFSDERIVFEAQQRNRRITKTFTLKSDEAAPYVFDLEITIEGDRRGLWLTSGVPEVEWISNGPAPALKYRITRQGKSEVNQLDKPKETLTMSTLSPDWICNSNGFFGVIMDPLKEIEPGLRAQYVAGTELPSRLVEIDEEHDRFKPQDLPGYLMMLPLKSDNSSMHFRVFSGPFSTDVLNTVDATFRDPQTGYDPDYIGSQSFHGWFAFISAPFSKFLFFLMRVFHSITGSWGFSIILLTVALRLMLYPLNAWSTKSMVKMQQITPLVQKIQEKHKKDPKKAQLEIMNLYRDKGVNPVSGCFPILIQMPFLIGMFDLLKSTFELRGATFIPGWIDNLAAPDVVFSWGTPLPIIGNSFHLLPILLGVVMFAQQRMMSTAPKDVNEMTEQQRQQRAMGNIMAVFFSFMFYKFPSGLNIYWLSSMLLGILQQWYTQKQLAAKK